MSPSRTSYGALPYHLCLAATWLATCPLTPATPPPDLAHALGVAVILDDGAYPTATPAEVRAVTDAMSNLLEAQTGWRVELLSVERVRPSAADPAGLPQRLLQQYYADHADDAERADFVLLFLPDAEARLYGGRTAAAWVGEDYCSRFPPPHRRAGVLYGAVLDWTHRYSPCGYDPATGEHVSDVSLASECRGRAGTPCLLFESDATYHCAGSNPEEPYFDHATFLAATALHELLHQYGSEASDDHYGTARCIERTGVNPWWEFETDGEVRVDLQEHCGMCPDLFGVWAETFVGEECGSGAEPLSWRARR